MPRNVVMDLDIEEGPKAMDPVAISGMSTRYPPMNTQLVLTTSRLPPSWEREQYQRTLEFVN